MNRTIGQPQAMNAPYGAEAQAASVPNSQVEAYLGKLDSRVSEVEEALAELRYRLSPFLVPKQDSNSHCIHALTERLKALRGAVGAVLSRL